MNDLFGGSIEDPVGELVWLLWKVPGWPRDEQKDRALIGELRDQFPGKDLADELGAWRVWMIANGTKEMVTSRGRYARVRNWVSERWINGGPGRAAQAAGSSRGRAGTGPRSAAEFGESRVVSW